MPLMDVHSYQNVSWNNMTNFGDMVYNMNASGAGWLFSGIDLLVVLVIFVTLLPVFGADAALMSAGFVGIILSMLFVYMGVMNFTYALVFVGVIGALIMYIIWNNRYD